MANSLVNKLPPSSRGPCPDPRHHPLFRIELIPHLGRFVNTTSDLPYPSRLSDTPSCQPASLPSCIFALGAVVATIARHPDRRQIPRFPIGNIVFVVRCRHPSAQFSSGQNWAHAIAIRCPINPISRAQGLVASYSSFSQALVGHLDTGGAPFGHRCSPSSTFSRQFYFMLHYLTPVWTGRARALLAFQPHVKPKYPNHRDLPLVDHPSRTSGAKLTPHSFVLDPG